MILNYARLCQVSEKFTKYLSRNLKTKVQDQNKGYTNSINLPKTKFPARLNPTQRAEVEELIRTVSGIDQNMSKFYNFFWF